MRKVKITKKNKKVIFERPSDRLKFLLEDCKFDKKRGTISKLHKYLGDRYPDGKKPPSYGAVRAWFDTNSPDMEDVRLVLELISEEYVFNWKTEVIADWWKVGGDLPEKTSSVIAVQEQRAEGLLQNDCEWETTESKSEPDSFEVTLLLFVDKINDVEKMSNLKLPEQQKLDILGKIMKAQEDFKNPACEKIPEPLVAAYALYLVNQAY